MMSSTPPSLMSKQIPENHAESHQDVVDRALYEAAKNGDLPAAFVAIQRGASLKALHDIRRETALHVAVYAGYKEMTAFLLQVGANVNCQTRLGRTALHLAVLSIVPAHRAEMVGLLLGNGADRSIRDADSKTALDYALEQGQFEVIELLDPPKAQPMIAEAIVPALVHAAASLHTNGFTQPNIPPVTEDVHGGFVQSV
jgi:ankyrin repeat protein